MDAEGMVVGCLLLEGGIALHGCCLFEGHAGLVLVVGLQVGEAQVEVGVLRQQVVGFGGHLVEVADGIRIDSTLIAGQTHHVVGITPGSVLYLGEVVAEALTC